MSNITCYVRSVHVWVNRNDQFRGYYRVRLKGRKHYKYIFWFSVNLAITNAYILHHPHTGVRGIRMKDFHVSLANQLINTSKTILPGAHSNERKWPDSSSVPHYCYKHRHKRRDSPCTARSVSFPSATLFFQTLTASLKYQSRHLSGDNQ